MEKCRACGLPTIKDYCIMELLMGLVVIVCAGVMLKILYSFAQR
jgi:hypothetical protein